MRTINKLPKKDAFIFSVYESTNDKDTNEVNHLKTMNVLINNNIAYKIVDGSYTHDNGLHVKERGFYVETNDNFNLHELYDFVMTQSKNASQESFLQLDADRNAQLVYVNGKTHGIGVFTNVSKDVALNSNAFTYCPFLESYFICK